MKKLVHILSSTAIMTSLLAACGQTPDATSRTKDVADCHSVFANRIYLAAGSYSGYLSVYPNGSGIGVASIDASDGLEASCGRSDVSGSLSYSYIPFTADYTLTLDLESASCGNRRIVVTGDCQSGGYAQAQVDGHAGHIWNIP